MFKQSFVVLWLNKSSCFQLEFHKGQEELTMPPRAAKAETKKKEKEEKRDKKLKKEEEKVPPIREWDRDKIKPSKRSRSGSREKDLDREKRRREREEERSRELREKKPVGTWKFIQLKLNSVKWFNMTSSTTAQFTIRSSKC